MGRSITGLHSEITEAVLPLSVTSRAVEILPGATGDVLRWDGSWTNSSAVTDLESTVSAVETSVSSNTASISTLEASVSSNTASISTLEASVSSNTASITAVAVVASANAADIVANASGIASNAADIVANAADIVANASGIATNTASISAVEVVASDNTTSITAVESSLTDVIDNVGSKLDGLTDSGAYNRDLVCHDRVLVYDTDPNRGVMLEALGGDGYSYTNYQGGLASWHSIGFRSTLDNQTRHLFDCRTGNMQVTGTVYAKFSGNGSLLTDIQSTALSGTLTNAQIQNPSITIGTDSIPLGGSLSSLHVNDVSCNVAGPANSPVFSITANNTSGAIENNIGCGSGLKLSSYTADNIGDRWAGVASVSEETFSNQTALALYSQGIENARLDTAGQFTALSFSGDGSALTNIQNSSLPGEGVITIGSTQIALGTTATTLTGLSSISASSVNAGGNVLSYIADGATYTAHTLDVATWFSVGVTSQTDGVCRHIINARDGSSQQLGSCTASSFNGDGSSLTEVRAEQLQIGDASSSTSNMPLILNSASYQVGKVGSLYFNPSSGTLTAPFISGYCNGLSVSVNNSDIQPLLSVSGSLPGGMSVYAAPTSALCFNGDSKCLGIKRAAPQHAVDVDGEVNCNALYINHPNGEGVQTASLAGCILQMGSIRAYSISGVSQQFERLLSYTRIGNILHLSGAYNMRFSGGSAAKIGISLSDVGLPTDISVNPVYIWEGGSHYNNVVETDLSNGSLVFTTNNTVNSGGTVYYTQVRCQIDVGFRSAY
jgi:hypothetical protein